MPLDPVFRHMQSHMNRRIYRRVGGPITCHLCRELQRAFHEREGIADWARRVTAVERRYDLASHARVTYRRRRRMRRFKRV